MPYLDDDDREPDAADWEDPDPQDADWDDTTDTVSCPYCKKQIAGEAEWCPHCGNYLSQEDTPTAGKPIWLIAGFIIVLLIVLTWIIRL